MKESKTVKITQEMLDNVFPANPTIKTIEARQILEQEEEATNELIQEQADFLNRARKHFGIC